jgi:hypothetical protein
MLMLLIINVMLTMYIVLSIVVSMGYGLIYGLIVIANVIIYGYVPINDIVLLWISN